MRSTSRSAAAAARATIAARSPSRTIPATSSRAGDGANGIFAQSIGGGGGNGGSHGTLAAGTGANTKHVAIAIGGTGGDGGVSGDVSVSQREHDRDERRRGERHRCGIARRRRRRRRLRTFRRARTVGRLRPTLSLALGGEGGSGGTAGNVSVNNTGTFDRKRINPLGIFAQSVGGGGGNGGLRLRPMSSTSPSRSNSRSASAAPAAPVTTRVP